MFADWNGNKIEIGKSRRGVIAVSHPFENLIKGDIALWPPPEIIQKMYSSNQAKAFENDDYKAVTRRLKYYCDLQSIHSEDAITWNVFGPVKYATKEVRIEFVTELLRNIGFQETTISDALIWLWRRIPHPETLVSGGPEIDFGLLTDKVCVLGEAKWLAGIGKKQGKGKDRDQIDLRIEFLREYSMQTFPDVEDFVVLELTPKAAIDHIYDTSCSHSSIHLKNITWETICGFDSHPCKDELLNHYQWKKKHSKTKYK